MRARAPTGSSHHRRRHSRLDVPSAACGGRHPGLRLWQSGGAVTSGMEAHPGGTAFAGALVEQAVAASPDLREVLTVAAAKLPARALFTPLFKGVTKTFSVWSPFPARRGSKGRGVAYGLVLGARKLRVVRSANEPEANQAGRRAILSRAWMPLRTAC